MIGYRSRTRSSHPISVYSPDSGVTAINFGLGASSLQEATELFGRWNSFCSPVSSVAATRGQSG